MLRESESFRILAWVKLADLWLRRLPPLQPDQHRVLRPALFGADGTSKGRIFGAKLPSLGKAVCISVLYVSTAKITFLHFSPYLSIHPSIYPSIIIYPSIHLSSSIHLSICLLNYSIYLQSAINNYTEDLALCAVYVGGKCGILNAQVRPLNRTICALACWPHHSMLLSDSRFAVAFIRFGPFWCVPLSWFLDTCQTI